MINCEKVEMQLRLFLCYYDSVKQIRIAAAGIVVSRRPDWLNRAAFIMQIKKRRAISHDT